MKQIILVITYLASLPLVAQTSPLWTEKKVKNYLPHMTSPEVTDFLKKSDIVIIPIGALEQHGYHLPIGTDFINGVERCKLIAQERDVLVAPILMAGQSPYHMEFAGTITLKPETIIQVHMEAVESLIVHGFKRFIILTAHTGNQAITTMIVDKINQITSAVAVDYDKAIEPFLPKPTGEAVAAIDQHGGTNETSNSLYLMPTLAQMEKSVTAKMTYPAHIQAMIPKYLEGDPTAKLIFSAETFKAKSTGKGTSAVEISTTGVFGDRDPKQSTSERGATSFNRSKQAAIKFIDRWNELIPYVQKK